jgi:FlaA1/EpsC-like NDP-sugar epimerase
VHRAVAFDALSAVVGALFGRLMPTAGPLAGDQPPWPVVAFPLIWVAAMFLARSYEVRYLWIGPEEFRRVFFAAVMLLACVGTVSWALKLELARSFVVVALPLATLLTLVSRYAQRAWLHRQRAAGRFQQTALLVGHRAGVAELAQQIERQSASGYRVIGACLPMRTDEPALTFEGLPVLGGLQDVVSVVQEYEVDTVAVLPSPELDGSALRRLGWDLEKTQADLLLAPSVTEVAGPRVHIRPEWGLPLLHVERAEFRGVRRVA